MCIRDSLSSIDETFERYGYHVVRKFYKDEKEDLIKDRYQSVSYTHLRAHETVLDLVCRLLLEKKKQDNHTITQLNINANNIKK